MAKVIARFIQLVMPNDLNNIGTLFGGKMVSWMDIAAAKAGQRFLRGTCAEGIGAVGSVTKAINEVVFSEPVFCGEWVNFTAKVMSTGKTSLTIHVSAIAENKDGKTRDVCEAIFTVVAVKKGKHQNWEKVLHGRSIK